MKNILIKILLIMLFIIPPFIFSLIHIETIGTEKEEMIEGKNFNLADKSETMPKISDIKIKYNIESDTEMVYKFDKMFRSYHFLDIQPDIIRHDLFLKHNISAEIFYSELLDENKTKNDIFNFTLVCDEVSIGINDSHKIKTGLKLNYENNKDKEYIEKIIKNCLKVPRGGFKNDLDRSIYFRDIKFPQDYKVTLIIKPDAISKFFIFFGWYVFWFGLIVLIRESVGKIFKKNN